MREEGLRALVRGFVAILVLTAATARTRAADARPIAGENVNMVSGTQVFGGDPFLQRQNEPSIAVSTANPNHLLAGANDYRTVDLNPNVDRVVGDAWLGLFKSFDGGRTWQSVLVPGYPQDRSAEGLASPIKGLSTAADPVVRAGTDGLFYYSGIAFNRGSNVGKVFVARFVDRNDKENGDVTLGRDPIRYLDTRTVDAGTAGQFIDKPWLATDVPRAGAATCTLPGIPATAVLAGNVYLAYAEFTGRTDTISKVMFARSTDCGSTWSMPQKLSESVHVNQGTAVAVDPLTGAVWVVWRRFASTAQDPAIMWVRSTDFGQTFTRPAVLAPLAHPFDQGYPAAGPAWGFRTNAFPSLAISTDGTSSWVHVAWTERASAAGDARVVMSTWSGTAWSAPAPVDAAPLADGAGNLFARGHQLMPSLTFSQGRLMLLYYDTRLDHTHRLYAPDQSCVRTANDGECLEYASPLRFPFHREEQIPVGELPADRTSPLVERVFNAWIQDVYTENGVTRPLQIRHTLDVRVAAAGAGPAPAFTSAPVSQFPFGARGDEAADLAVTAFGSGAGPRQVAISEGGVVKQLQQLQYNPGNLWLFKGGTVPFMGDYIDINGRAFVQDPVTRRWAFDWRPTPTPVFHAMWTSNQDVRPPADGDWTNYTPVSLDGSATSVFDGTPRRSCQPGQAGMRNQNVYTSRITEGLRVASPQNVKRLSAAIPVAFVVVAENGTDAAMPLTFEVQPTAAGVRASFVRDGAELRVLQADAGSHSSVSRSVFVTSANDPSASVTVTVTSSSGARGFVTLNPAGTSVALLDPDAAPPIAGGEVYTVAVASPNVVNRNGTNPNVVNPNVVNPNVVNPNVVNPNVVNPNVVNPNVVNPNVVNPNVVNPNVVNSSITSAPVSDATYQVTNGSNTTHSFHVKIVGTASAPSPLQAIVTQTYTTPDVQGCDLVEQQHDVVLSSAPDVSGAIVPPTAADLGDPNVADGRVSNLTFTLAPGHAAQLTLRGLIGVDAMRKLVTEIAPVVVPHAGASCGVPPCFAAPLLVTTAATLPAGRVGQPYSATLSAIGGAGSFVWSAASLPPGLSLGAGGQLAGTPTAGGTFELSVQVSDSATPANVATKSLVLLIEEQLATTITLTVSPSGSSPFGSGVATATVRGSAALAIPPLGTVTLLSDSSPIGSVALSALACVSEGTAPGLFACSASFPLTALTPAGYGLSAAYGGSATFLPSTSAVVTHAVVRATPAITFEPVATGTTTPAGTAATPAVYGQRVDTWFVVSGAPGATFPTGAFRWGFGGAPVGSCLNPLGGGMMACASSGVRLLAGTHTYFANYDGDGNYEPAAGSFDFVVDPATPAVTLTVAQPTPGGPVTFTATVVPPYPPVAVPGLVTILVGGVPGPTIDLLNDPSNEFATATRAFVLTAGTASFAARFDPADGNFTTATSAPVVFGVTAVP